MDDTATETDRMIAATFAAAMCTTSGMKSAEGVMAVYEDLLKRVLASNKPKAKRKADFYSMCQFLDSLPGVPISGPSAKALEVKGWGLYVFSQLQRFDGNLSW
jgi:hypothetical protein